FHIDITMKTRSTIRECGVQIWGASLYLSDWILSKLSQFQDAVVMELGAGVGLPGVVVARVCRRVFLTDYEDKSLRNCLRNVMLNDKRGVCSVRKLDWSDEFPIKKDEVKQQSEFDWTEKELMELKSCNYLLAADVIYSNELTTSFLNKVVQILSICREDAKLIMTIEKRYNFTLPELCTTCREYDFFFSHVQVEGAGREETCIGSAKTFLLRGKKLGSDFEKRLKEYDRSDEMELWELIRIPT
ncbi:hypothetical protein GUITHDRAFT_68765, partial [Guillardia theta CCMP2712]